ncbi:MAG: ATP-binding cassette domain-containing protein [Lachnospiraceae bacterium]|nr:ATP-binding cassette domain-containing protein [Lachnospiraceae bacterium]
MLETKELYKVYKPKKGVPVVALNKVSLKFPEKGMIFLLGKSGSGKSTLLNLLGGLDKYDGGDIIIKDVSSKDFKQSDFDSYRNTYVGFIFQEYNILDEFSVGANIALAIELQGRKATDEEINKILEDVDLAGYGNRKPNELSGGQKQRVAIARALVKNPQIIMADEPTGALDSNTGRQIFDTLKKLSKDKLVIIVSHDREFSELYADRIIELSDGNVISDVETVDNASDEKLDYDEIYQGLNFVGDTIEIAPGYHLTEEDRIEINKYIDQIKENSAQIVVSKKTKFAKKFVETNQDRIAHEDSTPFKTIKSKLPLKSAFKIGVSALQYKKVRLVFTILLSCIAFGLFDLADTFGAYDHVKTCTKSLIDSNVKTASLRKSVKEGDGQYSYYSDWNTGITATDMAKLENDLGIDFIPVIETLDASVRANVNWDELYKENENMSYNIYLEEFTGYSYLDKASMDSFGYSLVAGNLPAKDDEIAISVYAYMTFEKCGYKNIDFEQYDDLVHGKEEQEDSEYIKITKYEDMLGKTLIIDGVEYKISGIVDTNLDFERYAPLMDVKNYASTADMLLAYALSSEFDYEVYNGLPSVVMITENRMKQVAAKKIVSVRPSNIDYEFTDSSNSIWIYSYAFANDDELSKIDNIVWADSPKTKLGEKEIVLSASQVEHYMGNVEYDVTTEEGIKKLAKEASTINLQLLKYDWSSNTGTQTTHSGYKIVGIVNDFVSKSYSGGDMVTFVSDELYSEFDTRSVGEYDYVVGAMPEDKDDIRKFVEYAYADEDIRYSIQNAVIYELDTVDEVLKVMSKVFFWIGVFFAIFASILLANFIATSVAYKKQEIGILRAIGSRSNDVFRIFFSESFVIAMINFVLASIGVGGLAALINWFIRTRLGILVTILSFGIRQIVLIFVISILVAAVASFLPVKKIASKKPIDAIRNR